MHKLLALAVCVAASLAAQSTPAKQDVNASTIVFVCEHGAAKSVIAAAQFNKLAAERGLPYRAVSRGTKPDEAIGAAVLKGLAAEGIDVSTWRPTAVSDDDIRRSLRVVSLATDLPKTKPFAKTKLVEWNDIPPMSESYGATRAAIVEQVRKLVDSLATAQK